MSYHWNWEVFLQRAPSGGGTYLDWLIAGLWMTVALSLSGFAIALALGSVLGVLRTVPSRWLRGIGAAYVEVFRNVPLLVQLFIWYFVVPEIVPGGDAIKQLNPVAQQLFAGIVCLGLFTGARVCEQVRGGIQSLPSGQRAAALALGFTLPQTYRFVLLPMAFRIIVPPLTSELLGILKNSAVVSTIGLLELAAEGRQLVDYTAQSYESFIAVTVLYMLLSLILLVAMRFLERRTRVPGFMSAR